MLLIKAGLSCEIHVLMIPDDILQNLAFLGTMDRKQEFIDLLESNQIREVAGSSHFSKAGQGSRHQHGVNGVDDAVCTFDVCLHYLGVIYHDTAIGKSDSDILSLHRLDCHIIC